MMVLKCDSKSTEKDFSPYARSVLCYVKDLARVEDVLETPEKFIPVATSRLGIDEHYNR